MQFVYDENASKALLTIKDENYRYLFKARRLGIGDVVDFRNLEDDFVYSYKIAEMGKKEAVLQLLNSHKKTKTVPEKLHLIWCIIDPKVLYTVLPMLNQIGVSKITFVYCDRSQQNFKIDRAKVRKIAINSCQQSGRADLFAVEILQSLDEVLEKYSDFAVLDFGGETNWGEISTVLIGCEGGLSEKEREKLQNHYKIGLKTDFILKSETAALTIASKLLI